MFALCVLLRLLEVFMTGIWIWACGKVALAANHNFLRELSKREVLLRCLSFMPNDRITLSAMSDVGVLCLRRCSACERLAPGKQSTWIPSSRIVGSLAILESPIIMVFLVGIKVQFLVLSPLWAWWVYWFSGGEGGRLKSERDKGLDRPGGVPTVVRGSRTKHLGRCLIADWLVLRFKSAFVSLFRSGFSICIRKPVCSAPCVIGGRGAIIGGSRSLTIP